jgi:hypothetical protein
MTNTSKTTKKVRGNRLAAGMTIPGSGVIESITYRDYFPGWPAQPVTTVSVRFAPGGEHVSASYGTSEWVEVAR